VVETSPQSVTSGNGLEDGLGFLLIGWQNRHYAHWPSQEGFWV